MLLLVAALLVVAKVFVVGALKGGFGAASLASGTAGSFDGGSSSAAPEAGALGFGLDFLRGLIEKWRLNRSMRPNLRW